MQSWDAEKKGLPEAPAITTAESPQPPLITQGPEEGWWGGNQKADVVVSLRQVSPQRLVGALGLTQMHEEPVVLGAQLPEF